MDENGSQMWSNSELDLAVLIPRLYDIGQRKIEYKTKAEFHYKKLLESCATGDKTGAKQSHYRVQVYGNDYFTWYFLYVDKLDLCEHIEQLDVPALRLDARSEAVYLRLMIDHGERYYDEYFNESMDITWELGSYAEPNLSNDSMHMWWYINFTDRNLISLRESILEDGECLLDDASELRYLPEATCDGLSDCESGNIYEPHMDSLFENGCDTAVTALKAGSLVIIEYLQIKISKLQNELNSFGVTDSEMDGSQLLRRVCELNALETLGELQATSREIIDNLQNHIAALERELRALKCLDSTSRSPLSDTHLTSVSDTHPTTELRNNGESHLLHGNEETSHTGCLIIIEHLQAKVARLQCELSTLKCKQSASSAVGDTNGRRKDSGCDTQPCISDISVDDQIDSFSPMKVLVTPKPSTGEENVAPRQDVFDQRIHNQPSGDRKLSNRACEVEDQLPAPPGDLENKQLEFATSIPSSGKLCQITSGKSKWFPDRQGGSSVKLKRSQAFASNVLCLL